MMAAGSSTQEDLRYARALAEQGAQAPLIGGRIMVWWGLLLTVAYIVHHFTLTGVFGRDTPIFALNWVAFGLIGGIGQALLSRGLQDKPGAGSAGNLASRSVWGAAVGAIGAAVGGIVASVARGASPATFDWIVPIAFAVYGCALIVTSSLAGDRAVRAAGVGAIVMVGLFAALHQWPDRYLLAAAGVALTVLLPGIQMVRAEPN